MISTRLIARTPLRRAPFPLLAAAAATPHRLFATSALARFSRPTLPVLEASPVSQQPGSKNLKDMGKNAAEEAKGPSHPRLADLSRRERELTPRCARKGVAKTVAEAIAGGANDVTSQNAPKEKFGAGDIAADIVRSLRAPFFGLSG